MYTNYELSEMTREELETLILAMQDTALRGKKIVQYYERKKSVSKYSSITPEMVAKMHVDGYTLTEIQRHFNAKYKDSVPNFNMSLQVIIYKLKQYEKANNVLIYKPGPKGRKKKGRV